MQNSTAGNQDNPFEQEEDKGEEGKKIYEEHGNTITVSETKVIGDCTFSFVSMSPT